MTLRCFTHSRFAVHLLLSGLKADRMFVADENGADILGEEDFKQYKLVLDFAIMPGHSLYYGRQSAAPQLGSADVLWIT